jgi:ribonuclease P protein component
MQEYIVKAGDIFLYKILGNAPFDELHNIYKKLIDKLFKEGKNYSSKNILLKRIDGDNLYMVSVPIKNFKRAVDRNKIKRLLRNLVSNLKIGTFVVIYTGKEIPKL